jgi:hypothetical protein
VSSLGVGLGIAHGRRSSGGPPPDTTPPDPVVDLAVASHVPGGVNLAWTVPGPSGSPPATFEVRRNADGFVSESDWSTAISHGVWPSNAYNTTQGFLADGMSAFEVFIFVVRTRDAAGNLSAFSNQVTVTIT